MVWLSFFGEQGAHKKLPKMIGWRLFNPPVMKDPETGEMYIRPFPEAEKYLTNPEEDSNKEPRLGVRYEVTYVKNSKFPYRCKFGWYRAVTEETPWSICEEIKEWDRLEEEYNAKYSEYQENKEKWMLYDAAVEEQKDIVAEEMQVERKKALEKANDGLFPESCYADLPTVIDILENGRAEDVATALRYMDERRSAEHEHMRAERRANKSERYRVLVFQQNHESERVHVDARSEAEAINAAMNMVPNAIKAEIMR